VPRIHDISTDTKDPPPFVDVLPYRHGAWNPPGYSGAETAAQQHKAWPHLGSLDVSAPRPTVQSAARRIMTSEGWRIVGEDPAAGRLEAIVTTSWLRFKDDVVVRLRDRPDGGTRVDVRSKSRIGRNDLGTNARRVLAFLAHLRTALEAAR